MFNDNTDKQFHSYRIFMAILAVLKIGPDSWYMSFSDADGYETLTKDKYVWRQK